ncbi:MAG TPA: RagB/SusD family nutrient uptake outer membrane protein [Chitinophagaceae bacterium]|nr:RagB/SusD family nutrient uptake outer membrane protein [Chitinophagaceae bacterium]
MKAQNKSKLAGLIVLASMFIALSSCKKSFLDLRPYTSVSSDVAITNESDMQAALNGAYGNMNSVNLYGRTTPLFGDLVSDNVYISTINSNRYLDFFQINYTVTDANGQGIWQSAYSTILRANNVINSSLQGNENVNQLRGEALAIRGLMYFELVKFFAKPYAVDPNALGVPLILAYDPTIKPQRNTVQEVYAQIEKDFTDAANLMTQDKSSGFFTKWAAKALLARMYQFKGEWDKALTTAEDVINNSGYSLLGLNDVLSFWQNNTDRDDKLEVLFEIVFDATNNIGNSSLPYFFDQSGYGDALAAESLYDLYSNTDVRKDLFIVGSAIRGADVKVINKFPNTGSADKDEMKVIRMSEVYFIAAEAAYHQNDETKALTYLNDVATERDPGFAGYSSAGQALLDDILLERRKELAFEGHRYWDLVRNNLDVTRVDLANDYPGNVPLVLETTNFRRILPIPQGELDANPNIREQQNSGY